MCNNKNISWDYSTDIFLINFFLAKGYIEEIKIEMNKRWYKRWQNAEKTRFSDEQEIFFNQLRIMTKYHMWQKVGRGIVTFYLMKMDQ